MTEPRPSMLHALRRAHLRLALAAVVMAGLMITLLSALTLRSQVEQNLRLVARSVAYSAEAAIEFDDTAAASDALQAIAVPEGLRSAQLLRPDGSSLARYERPRGSGFDEAMLEASSWLFPLQASLAVQRQGRTLGHVRVHGDGGIYLSFLAKVLGAVVLCTALIGWQVTRLTRRIERDIVRPLHKLAALTRTARTSRAFDLRAPSAVVAEVHNLGEDFNALIAEIQGREAELVAKHDKLRTANASLSFLAFHDSLTGLPNRARFLERVDQALRQHGGGEARVAVLFVDCDDFKSINDTLGHAAGDALLVEVALRIRSQLREDGLVARLGGDEFAVLLAPIGSLEHTLKIAQRIAAAIREPMEHALYGTLRPSASVGVAVFPEHGTDAARLMAAADAAMYRAKALQGGQVVLAASADAVATPPSVAPSTMS